MKSFFLRGLVNNMKVLHIGLVSHFTVGMMYQDNILPVMNINDGHDVVFVTDTCRFDDGILIDGPEEKIRLNNGLLVIRLKYEHIINRFVTKHIQKATKLKSILEDFQPDAIMYHNAVGYELMDVANYIKKHRHATFYVDSHSDFNNSAKTMLAKVSYKLIHGHFVKKALPYIDKFLALSTESVDFLKDIYHIPDEMCEIYPLGGLIKSEEEQKKCRDKLLHDLNLRDNTLILSHSGKLDHLKKTADILRAFKRVDSNDTVLLVFGMIQDEEKDELVPLIKADQRVHFLGWKSGEDITDILSGSDLYLQPGSMSATSQVAACCGCAELVAPTPSYKNLYGNSVDYAEDENGIYNYILSMIENPEYVEQRKKDCYQMAKEKLDYAVLARRYLHKEKV